MPRILVIDDEAAMREFLTAALQLRGYEVIDTGQGQVGIELAVSENPDLVLCDVVLLDISGYEVLRALRARPETHNTPVVLITGMADLQGMRQGMTLGADDYVPKPFAIEELLNLIAARLRKAEGLRHEAEDKAKRLRSHISMMLPHELLSPLTGIIGMAGVLCQGSETLKASEAVEIGRDIQRSGERLHRIIRNFLIYSQLELLAAEPERIAGLRQAVPAQFRKVLSEVAERVAERHHRRADLVLEAVSAEVAMSEANLSTLCEELLDNAFKFSVSGRPVEARARLTGGKLWMTLTDEGCGIDDETLNTVRGAGQFERLFTEKRSIGLGLAIAVRMAELHNGRALIQSQVGTGTSILVELPLAPPKPVAESHA